MAGRTIVVTEPDMKLLRSLIQTRKDPKSRDYQRLATLAQELDEAQVIRPEEVSPDVVTMNSRVHVRDIESKDEAEYSVVFPAEADTTTGKVSVLAPIGAALLGYEKGDKIEVQTPRGKRTLRIERVLYQPEATDTPGSPAVKRGRQRP